MKKRYKILIGIFILLGLTIVFPPRKNEGDLKLEAFISETNPAKNVQLILKKACYDCHSNQTKYPKYYNYPVVNYWVANHINEGKNALNFSEWGNYNNYQKSYVLKKSIEELENRKMPLITYIIKHPEAQLNKEQVDLVVNWIRKQDYE